MGSQRSFSLLNLDPPLYPIKKKPWDSPQPPPLNSFAATRPPSPRERREERDAEREAAAASAASAGSDPKQLLAGDALPPLELQLGSEGRAASPAPAPAPAAKEGKGSNDKRKNEKLPPVAGAGGPLPPPPPPPKKGGGEKGTQPPRKPRFQATPT